jgi:hypothetical protein
MTVQKEARATFERLADKFSTQSQIKKVREEEIEPLMETAGKFLYSCIQKRVVDLGRLPKWFRQAPTITRWQMWNDRSGKEVEGEIESSHWDTYWWCAVVWLGEERPLSGIVLPSHRIGRVSPPKYWDSFIEFFERWTPKTSNQAQQRIRKTILAASSDACGYLASRASRSQRELTKSTKPPDQDIGGHSEDLVIKLDSREAFFNGQRLNINRESEFIVLKMLHERRGAIIEHAEFECAIRHEPVHDRVEKQRSAHPLLKDSVYKLRAALKAVGAPHQIGNAKSRGYQMLLPGKEPADR